MGCKYYGIILTTMTKPYSYQLIEGNHDYKPSVETVGFFGTCFWFRSEEARSEKLLLLKRDGAI